MSLSVSILAARERSGVKSNLFSTSSSPFGPSSALRTKQLSNEQSREVVSSEIAFLKKVIVALGLSCVLLIVCNVCTTVALLRVAPEIDVKDGQLVLRGTNDVLETRNVVPTITIDSNLIEADRRDLQGFYVDSELGGGWRKVQSHLASTTTQVLRKTIETGTGEIQLKVGKCKYSGKVTAANFEEYRPRRGQFTVKQILVQADALPNIQLGPYGVTCNSGQCSFHCFQTGEIDGVRECYPRGVAVEKLLCLDN